MEVLIDLHAPDLDNASVGTRLKSLNGIAYLRQLSKRSDMNIDLQSTFDLLQ